MIKFRESRTAKNLMLSFAGESQARNRYTYFSRQAADDGYVQISDIFEETANQECEHALRFFKFFNGGEMEFTGSFPSGVIKNTYDNLIAAAAGEKLEHSQLYPSFAKIAREEGFERAADTWDAISVSERQHEKRYLELAANIEAGRVFKRDAKVKWRCSNCGYIHEGTEAPERCPTCAHPQGWFIPVEANY